MRNTHGLKDRLRNIIENTSEERTYRCTFNPLQDLIPINIEQEIQKVMIKRSKTPSWLRGGWDCIDSSLVKRARSQP